jgi:NitT/TauT family transport system ATP-binding protein
MVEKIHDAVTGVHLPEEEPAPAPTLPGRAAIGPFVPLPPATVGEMLGLLEILADHGGEMDLFDVDALTEWDFGRTIAVVKAAELLDLVDTPKNRVLLTDPGRALVAAAPREKPILFRRQLLGLGTFVTVVRALARREDASARGEDVRDMLAERLPSEATNALFETLVNWGRFAQLLAYDAPGDELALFGGRAGDADA